MAEIRSAADGLAALLPVAGSLRRAGGRTPADLKLGAGARGTHSLEWRPRGRDPDAAGVFAAGGMGRAVPPPGKIYGTQINQFLLLGLLMTLFGGAGICEGKGMRISLGYNLGIYRFKLTLCTT